jgi:hypothetical protein
MAGRFIRITESDTANKGDGEWYEISSVASATSLTLVKPYTGTAISAGNAAYTIGQMPPLPDGYHELPVYRAVAHYYAKNDQERSAYFKGLADELYAQLETEFGSATESVVIEDANEGRENPNLFITA